MLKKYVNKFSVGMVIFCTILASGAIFGAIKQEPHWTDKLKDIIADESFTQKILAVKSAYAEEREDLGLPGDSGGGDTPESDLGEPRCMSSSGGSGGGGGAGSFALSISSESSTADSGCADCSKGAPVWMLNLVNMNLYMKDTPLWYTPSIGPSVEVKLSYNSRTTNIGHMGFKWIMNYGSYLYTMVDSKIAVVMPDGKIDIYGIPDGSGNCAPPYQVFNSLNRIAGNHFELRFLDDTVYVYDIPAGTTSSVSLLTEIRDAYGQKLTMAYDSAGKLLKVTDATGGETTFSYNAGGLLTAATDPFGRSAAFEYDANQNLTKITDMGGYWTSFTYVNYVLTDYYLSSLSNPAGTWGFYFEPCDDSDIIDPYPAPGTAMGPNYRITITNPSGGSEEYYRSGFSTWHVSHKNYLPYTDADHNNYASDVPKTLYSFVSTEYRRTEVGEVISPEGNSTYYYYEDIDDSYKNTGNLTGMSGDGTGISITYNTKGKFTSRNGGSEPDATIAYAANGVDMTGYTTGLGTVAYTYNGTHNVLSMTNLSGNTRTFEYNAFGQPTKAVDEAGITTAYTYNASHRLSQITQNGQKTRAYTYDTIGRVKTGTDANGLTLTYTYNSLNDVTRITYPDSRYIGFAYSSSVPHLLTAITDRGGKTTQYVYNAYNTLTGITDPDGGIIQYTYDADGNLTGITDQKNQVTLFEYDKDNRLVKKTFADGSSESFAYDASDRLISKTNGRNQSISYILNPQSNPVWKMYSDFMTFPVMYMYDSFYRRTEMIDAAGTYEYSYDVESRPTLIDGPLDNDNISFQYDVKGRMTKYTIDKGQSVVYAYDGLDRVTTVTGSAGVFTYTYSGAGDLVTKLTRPNGSYTEYQYDALKRLTGITNKKSSGVVINQFLYTYDNHDLIAETNATNEAVITPLQTGTVSYSYGLGNKLSSSTNPNTTFVHDADGNLIQGIVPAGYVFTGSYDIENHLISLSYITPYTYMGYPVDNEHSTEYTYNGDGVLAKMDKQVDIGEEDQEINYVRYNYFAFQERDDSNVVTREYTWGVDYPGGIGGLLSLKQGGQYYYYLYDRSGNVTALIDSSQNVVATYGYDPFGQLLAKNGTVDQPYRFSTKSYDEETGLCYYGYRYYSSSLGRWISRDPMGEDGGLNLYEFVSNSPSNFIDPDGRGVLCDWFGVLCDKKKEPGPKKDPKKKNCVKIYGSDECAPDTPSTGNKKKPNFSTTYED